MKKKFLGLAAGAAVVGLAALSLTSCSDPNQDSFVIGCWNNEFREFFNLYVSDEGVAGKVTLETKESKRKGAKGYHLDGKPVVWIENPSDDGVYQGALDKMLPKNETAKRAKKLDMFLAESDYILKYVNSNFTKDVSTIGVTAAGLTQAYDYTVSAATDSNGKMKGVSFQCCPAGMIYNRVVAKEVLGTDDPAQIQALVSDWTGFDAVAAQMKAAGKYMTACDAETYRVFSNNTETAWVTDGKVKIPAAVEAWIDQADAYMKAGYTIAADVWSGDKVENIKADANNTFACFGPAWYYNFCMGDAKPGDWGVVKGPQAYFWGGTWMLAANGGDDDALVKKVMDAFTNNAEICEKLIANHGQFTNNKAVNEAYAAGGKGNAFLGGQNDTAIFVELAADIKFEHATVYDQQCNEGIQEKIREYLKGTVTKEQAIANFYTAITETFPNLQKAE